MVNLEAMSVRDTRECMSLWDGCSVLWVVKAVVYVIGVNTVSRVLGIIDGVSVFHLVLVMEDGWGMGRWVVWWGHVLHSANTKDMVMSVRYS